MPHNGKPPVGNGHPAGIGLTERQLLRSVTEAARNLLGAAAASVFLLDQTTGELVFEAVSGEGEDWLPGTRFAPGTGIAGWVASSGQPMLVDDLAEAVPFSRDAAESTGYVPGSILAAPLVRNGECLGVLEVLDRGSRPRGDLQDVDLLGLFAAQAAIGVELLARLRLRERLQPRDGHGGGSWERQSGAAMLMHSIAQRLPATAESTADTVEKLLIAADEILRAADRGPGQRADG